MNLSGNQRKLYLLSVVLLALILVLCGAWGLWHRAGDEGAQPQPTGDMQATTAPSPEPTAPASSVQPAATPRPEGTVQTTVYYQDNYGYLVPVTRTVPEEAGIAKATLSMMVKSAYNDMEAARLGLRTVLPENTQIDLDITGDGTAKIDLSKEALDTADAAAEANMVAAVVQTLTEFPTVERVSFMVGGQKVEKLKHGTDISGEFERGTLNLESSSAGLAPSEAKTVMLYFPGEASSLIVPVTRMVYGNSDIDTAVLELTKGPSASSPLDSALPAGCGLIGVKVENGVATINFTKEFIHVAEDSDGGRAALRALVLTCTQFDGVEKVQVQVEGEPYDPGASTLAVPTFVNEASAIAEEYIRTQTAAIIDMED